MAEKREFHKKSKIIILAIAEFDFRFIKQKPNLNVGTLQQHQQTTKAQSDEVYKNVFYNLL